MVVVSQAVAGMFSTATVWEQKSIQAVSKCFTADTWVEFYEHIYVNMRELGKGWGKRKAYDKEIFYSLKKKKKTEQP